MVIDDGDNLYFVSDKFKTEEICAVAVSNDCTDYQEYQ